MSPAIPTLYLLTHPEVEVDPERPVTQWSLSDVGRTRLTRYLESGALAQVASIYSSGERKALEAAALIAQQLRLPVHERAELGENDRSSTGFLKPSEFEAAADAFFRQPELSFRGWETALAAQARMVRAVERVLAESAAPRDTLIVSHGAVSTLYKCHVRGIAITRAEDQPGQGHVLRFDKRSLALLEDWRAL